MKQAVIRIASLIFILLLTLTLIACDDNKVDGGAKSTDATSTEVPSDGEPNEDPSNEEPPNEGDSDSDKPIDLPFVPF